MLYRKTLPHHGRTFYGSLQLSRLFQKMHAFGGRCFLVFLVSVLGVCVSVYYHFTPGIPFDRNLFAALGMIPGAFLCALFLLMPYGGWIPALICAFAGALFAPATAADSHDALGLHGRNSRVSGSRPSASGAARRRTGGLA